MRVALVYDRLNKIGGAEQVLIAFHELFPKADWYTSFWDPNTAPFSRNWQVHASWLNKISLIRQKHEWFPYLMPFIFEYYDFSQYDLVISIGSAEAKGIITKPSTYHLHYCLTPTRYLYSHRLEYLKTKVHYWIADILRKWDSVAATRPDEMIAISTQVKNRTKKYYKRDADIIFPPVDTKKFAPTKLRSKIDDLESSYFLVVSRLVPYKKIDVLIKAANLAGVRLLVIGTGSQYNKLSKLAGPTVSLLGFVPDFELVRYYAHAKAFLQANVEDFGIAMCEALSSGVPVIAKDAGGARDIVIPGKNGVLLQDASVAGFAIALKEFDTMSFVASDCTNSVARFDKEKWKKKIKERIKDLWTKKEM